MKRMIIGLILSVSAMASAQSAPSSVQQQKAVPETETVSQPTTLATAVDQTLTTQQKSQTFTGSFILAAFASARDVRENGNGAMIDSSNSIGGYAQVTEKAKVGILHNFGLRAVGDSKQLADYSSDNGSKSGYKTLDPSAHFDYSLPSIFGSNPFRLLTRYYIPISPDSSASQSNGILRTQAFITWTLNPKFDLSFYGQARLYMNSQANKESAVGSDSILRTIAGPVFGYNFNDVYNVYYNPYLDVKSTGFQRGNLNADFGNNLTHEVGAWITLASGNFIINPAWVTSSSKLGTLAYEGAGSDANTEYDLNLIATF